MATRSSDDFDGEHTDELPVLHDTGALGDGAEPLLLAPLAEDTGEHTAFFVAGSEADDGSPLLAELTARAEQIPALEAQIGVLTDATRDLEQALATKDRSIAELEETLAALRRSADDAAAAERRAAAQLAVRDGRLAELTAALERLQEEGRGNSTELERLRAQADSARAENEALRAELSAKAAPEPQPGPDLDGLREENAALAAYIAGRRSWWDELTTTQADLAARVAALTSELKVRDQRLAAADDLAARESQRAFALRAELVDYARRAEALERELKLARAGQPPRPVPDAVESAVVLPPLEGTAAPAPPPATPNDAAAGDAAAGDASPPVLTDAVGAAAPAGEAVAQLEAEVEYKRQQVAAQLVELRDREQRLRAVAGELERARRDLGALRAELEESRASAARLEKAVIDKDRALEARDARIVTLHEELKLRLAAGERRADLPLAPIDRAALPRSALDLAADATSGPALLCLTGDAPKRFALTKKTITVGRGPQCDLQILTHFVSREHARLVSNDGVTLIEDLGSRNGVFVNAVRVDRRHLRQGDLVTIGETQFRFVESVAH